MPQRADVRPSTSSSRRALLRFGLTVPASVLLAACSPAKSLTPGRSARLTPTPSSAPPEHAAAAAQATPRPLALTTPTAKPAEVRRTATPILSREQSGQAVSAAGGSYRVYPEITGTVRFWHAWDGPRLALVEGLIADMRARYPSIRIESDAGDPASARDRLVTALASGAPPNAVMLRSDSIAYFAEADALLPIDDLLARDGVDTSWFGSAGLATRSWDGQTYGLPQTTGGAEHLLFVNLDLLERIGVDPARPIRTWQDLDALVEPAAQAGLLVIDPVRVGSGNTAHQVWTYANGGRYWDSELKKITWTQPASVEAAEWLIRLAQHQSDEYRALSSGGDPRTPLSTAEWAAERTICCLNGAGWFFQLQQHGRSIRYAAYDLPRNGLNPASHGESPTSGGWTLVLPTAATDREAAWEWIKLATLSPGACAFTARQQRPSPLADCDERTGLPAGHPFWPVLSGSLAKSVPLPTSPLQPKLEQIYRRMQDELLIGHLAPAEALERAARDAQPLLDDWHASRKRLSGG